MDPLGLQPNYVTWLLGQSGMVIVLVLWIWTQSRELRALRQRNEKLQDSLLGTVEKGMSERLRMAIDNSLTQDSTFRNMLLSLERVFTETRKESEPCSGKGSGEHPQIR